MFPEDGRDALTLLEAADGAEIAAKRPLALRSRPPRTLSCVKLDDVIEETVAVAGRDLRITRPRDSEALLDEDRFEPDEYVPYWAELWPSSRVLARLVAARSLRGARTLELGCGLGLVSTAAALAGGRVLATDWAPESVEFTAANAERNDAVLETLACDWAQPAALVERAPWDLVLGSDVLYELRNGERLLELLPRLVAPRGEVWIADPGRPASVPFLEWLGDGWLRETRSVREGGVTVAVHKLRPGGESASDRPGSQRIVGRPRDR